MRHRVALSEAMDQISRMDGPRFATLFRHGSLQVEIYAPRVRDDQTPHTRDEVYVVVWGEGFFVCGDTRERFGPGDFLFAPAGMVHRFEEFTDDLTVWVLFYGPVGGEREEEAAAQPAATGG
jgi:mannose-6-phosphate isomerase-like protein (cupin superfamily)